VGYSVLHKMSHKPNKAHMEMPVSSAKASIMGAQEPLASKGIRVSNGIYTMFHVIAWTGENVLQSNSPQSWESQRTAGNPQYAPQL
jgi:hypothetical protein